MKVRFEKFENAPEFGTWGKWYLGKEQGTFGCSLYRGMWATMDDIHIGLGLETYEQSLTEEFEKSIIKWRKLNAKLKKYAV